MRCLNVALAGVAARSYPILSGPGLLARGALIAAHLPAPSAVIISNEVVAPLYLEPLRQALHAQGVAVRSLVLPDGEAHKQWTSLEAIFTYLLEARCDRQTSLIALGGGVIGDLTGFAAASYQRGVPFVQVPTTLLAQVDSSVGGKTGINHPQGKNMIGAFWQPLLVLADTDTLRTLPERELSAGLAEVIKYGLIRDPEFLDWLEAHMSALRGREADALAYAIECSCANKAAVVAEDERETAAENGRALLNLGHSFAHAIEAGMGYGTWLHGEAVGAGMVMAADLSQRLGWIDQASVQRVRALCSAAGLPVFGPRLGNDRYLEFMGRDKKNLGGKRRLVLLKALGAAITSAAASDADIAATLDACCA